SVLPKLLEEHELVGGNALVEMGTFLAILAGTITAGVMMATDGYAQLIAGSVVLVAVA
ncbi:MAG TPA: MFS transporter, partial [Pseudomonas sp.]|nr:MFS transporter [Pseudomonas sp.]